MHSSARDWGPAASTLRTSSTSAASTIRQGFASQTILTNVPVHNFVDDVSWTKGTHTIQFGTNWRLIHNNRQSNADNISYGQTNLYWLNPSFIANEGVSLDPSLMDSNAAGSHLTWTPTSAPPTASPPWTWLESSARPSPRPTRTKSANADSQRPVGSAALPELRR